VDAFVALGGKANKKGTISRDKIAFVLLNDFELTLDMDVSLRVKEIEIYEDDRRRDRGVRL